MANISHEDMVKRVAARFIRSQQEQQEQQGQQEQQALPQSGPGKSMVKGALDKVMGAFEKGDESSFHTELDNLLKVSKHG